MRTLALLPLLLAAPLGAQDTLRLGDLQAAAVRHDPRSARLALEEAATALRLRVLAAERLPDVAVSGEAARQSEVAALPVDVPGVDVPAPPASTYELAVGADWLLLDGGLRAARAGRERARLAAARAELAARLEPLRTEVAEAFFGALLAQERLRELAAPVEALEARLAEARARLAEGAALPGDTAAVQAELLRLLQRQGELRAEQRALRGVLGRLTGRTIAPGDVLVLPELDPSVAAALGAGDASGPTPATARAHPQYAVFDALRAALTEKGRLIRTGTRPRLSAFGRLAWGRPGPRQFTDEPHEYWRGGVRVRWAPWDRGRARELELLDVERLTLDAEQAAFAERLARGVEAPLERIAWLRGALDTDERIIALRAQVERQARAQLAEGAITPAAYVASLTDLEQARAARLRHRVELARAQAQILTTLGIEIP